MELGYPIILDFQRYVSASNFLTGIALLPKVSPICRNLGPLRTPQTIQMPVTSSRSGDIFAARLRLPSVEKGRVV